MKPNRAGEETLLFPKFQQGDKKVLNTLFREHYPTLCAYAYRFVDLENAEEIVQDMMFRPWKDREILLIESSLSQYLLKMIYRRILNRTAQKEVKHHADTLFHKENQAMIYDVDFCQIEELTKRIHTAIAASPGSYRRAFITHRFKGMSYKEIAEFPNISIETVDYRTQQALKLPCEELKELLSLALIFLAAQFTQMRDRHYKRRQGYRIRGGSCAKSLFITKDIEQQRLFTLTTNNLETHLCCSVFSMVSFDTPSSTRALFIPS